MEKLTLLHFFILATAAVTSTIMVPFVARLAVSVGGIDPPGPRKIHVMSVPRLGGIAIFCAFLSSIIYFCEMNTEIKGFLAGAMVVFVTGLVDDLFGMTPRQKFIGQFFAATLVVLSGDLCVRNLGNPFGVGTIDLGPLAIPFTIFGIVGMINAINLMDGMDGLAGGVCSIICVDFAVLAYSTHNMHLFVLSLALLGGLLGFMRYNSHPAIIFMGDAGSLLLGYCMGVFAVLLVNAKTLTVSPYIPLILLGLPVMDTLVVMVNRYRAGRSAFLPDQTHIHHRLMHMGLGQKSSVLILYGITYLLSLVAIFGRNLSDPVLLLLLALIISTVYGTLQYVATRGSGGTTLIPTPFTFRAARPVVRLSRHLLTVVKYLLLGILLLPVLASGDDISLLFLIPSLLLVVTVCFYLSRCSWSDLILQFFVYVVGYFMIFMLEIYGNSNSVRGVPLHHVSHALFLLLLAVEGALVFICRRSLRLITSPLDYLILLIAMCTPLLPSAVTGTYHLLTVTTESVVLFIAFKLVLMRKIRRNRKILLAIVLSLSIMVVRYGLRLS